MAFNKGMAGLQLLAELKTEVKAKGSVSPRLAGDVESTVATTFERRRRLQAEDAPGDK